MVLLIWKRRPPFGDIPKFLDQRAFFGCQSPSGSKLQLVKEFKQDPEGNETENLFLMPRASGDHSNLQVLHSVIGKNGDPQLTTREQFQYHDNTEFFVLVKEGIFDKVAPLYEQGLSLREIQVQTGISKTTARKALLNGGICLRDPHPTSFSNKWKAKGKQAASPPYGFCYFQGTVVPHPKEYETLHLIHKLWQKGINSNAIATELNGRRIPSRMAKQWSWNAVKNIVDRLMKKQIILSGGKYEFR